MAAYTPLGRTLGRTASGTPQAWWDGGTDKIRRRALAFFLRIKMRGMRSFLVLRTSMPVVLPKAAGPAGAARVFLGAGAACVGGTSARGVGDVLSPFLR
ncbi:MAG: hypothetical protein HW388_1239 [Dehalococcoidia bacterium]|nr:hypothetical protein [Dehalococcoidia bacterium]